MSTFDDYVHRFLAYGHTDSEFPLYQYDGGISSYTIHLSGLIHGNEVGSLPTLIQLIESLETGAISFGGKINITLGNPEASKVNRRFIDADLNRLFLQNQPIEQRDTHEGKRARAMMPILEECDLILDLHQTMLPSAMPFYIFPNTPLSLAIAEAIGGTNAYIDATPTDNAPKYQCADEFVWRQGKPSLTLELGEVGFHQPATHASRTAVQNLLKLIDTLIKSDLITADPKILLSAIQSKQTETLSWYQTVHREPYASSTLRLKPGLINFHPVQKGEKLSADNSPLMTAPCNGRVLFPKYPRRDVHGNICEALPKEIYRIIQEL